MDKKAYLKEYYQKNKEKIKAQVRAAAQRNREAGKSWLKLNGHRPKVRFDKAKGNTKSRGKSWELTFEQYAELISKPCYYCGADMSKDKGSGLDRLDNSGNYTSNNVVPCCYVCNTGRNHNFTPEEWKVGILAILAFRKQVQS